MADDRACAQCGEPFTPHERERNPRRWCSEACRAKAARRSPTYQESERRRGLTRQHASRALTARQKAARVAQRRAARGTSGKGNTLAMGHCAQCGEGFTARSTGAVLAAYCSESCKRTHIRDRRRARKRDAFVSNVNRTDIFDRDRWVCQLCHGRVDPRLDHPHMLSASLDHVIPLAKGGTHEPKNCQLAHLICNSRKSDGAGSEQLRLLA